MQLLALTLFAVNPIYIGWITTLGKDAQYMVWMLLLGVLMMEFLAEPEAFCRKKSRWVLLTADSLLAVLTRYNGVSVAVPCLAARPHRPLPPPGAAAKHPLSAGVQRAGLRPERGSLTLPRRDFWGWKRSGSMTICPSRSSRRPQWPSFTAARA